MTNKETKQEGIFIPYKITENFEVKYKLNLGDCLSLLENTQLVQNSINENLKPLLLKVVQNIFIKGVRLGNDLDDLDDEIGKEALNKEFNKIIKSLD